MGRSLFALLILISLSLPYSLFGQIAAPEAEDVFGGRILGITGISLGGDSSRIFISTESANSLFYSKSTGSHAANTQFEAFKVLPVGSASAGLGSSIQFIAAHEGSQGLVFAHPNGLEISLPPYSSSISLSNFMISDLHIEGNHVFWMDGSNFNFGTLDATGTYTSGAGSPITLPSSGFPMQMEINPSNNLIYILVGGSSPLLYKSSDSYSSLTSSSSFSSVSLTGFSSSTEWRTLGISQSGRIFIGGHENAPPTKYIRYTDNELIWVDAVLGGVSNGVSGANLEIGLSNHIYFGSIFSANNGLSWSAIGNAGLETNPNDGRIMTHPQDDSLMLVTTDMGLAASLDAGNTLFEINEGIEAVQVNDLDMTLNKENAWVASKSGIRKVSHYQTSPQWSSAIYPNGDGSPYYSVAMEPEDTNQVYVGNVRVYKTLDGGANWTLVFSPESTPYNFPNYASGCMALEVAPWDSALVMAGYQVFDGDEGGLFLSVDAGSTWTQILIEASGLGFDVDVSDIAFNIEGNDTVAYVSVLYDLSSPQGRSIYRLLKSGTTWTPSQEFNPGGTSTGSAIVASLEDVFISSTGDTLLTVGTDAGNNHPIAYYKIISGSGLWTPFTTSGFPFIAGKKGRAITLGVDTIYCAVDHEIYIHTSSGAWSLGHAYPSGTKIEFLYFDDLLAGTGTGLYNHPSSGGSSIGLDDVKKDEPLVLKAFPNPVEGELNLELNPYYGQIGSLRVFTPDGSMIHSERYHSKSIQLNTSQWATGIYLIEIRTSSGKEEMLRILK